MVGTWTYVGVGAIIVFAIIVAMKMKRRTSVQLEITKPVGRKPAEIFMDDGTYSFIGLEKETLQEAAIQMKSRQSRIPTIRTFNKNDLELMNVWQTLAQVEPPQFRVKQIQENKQVQRELYESMEKAVGRARYLDDHARRDLLEQIELVIKGKRQDERREISQ